MKLIHLMALLVAAGAAWPVSAQQALQIRPDSPYVFDTVRHQPLPRLHFHRVRFDDAIQRVQAHLPILLVVDWLGLQQAGVMPDTLVSLDVPDATTPQLLDALCHALATPERTAHQLKWRLGRTGNMVIIGSDRPRPRWTGPVPGNLPAMKLDGVPLEKALEQLRQHSGIEMRVDWDALAEGGIQRTTPISGNWGVIGWSGTLSRMLRSAETASGAAGLDRPDSRLLEGRIHVTTRRRLFSDAVEMTYEMEHETARAPLSPEDIANLQDLLTSAVAGDSWSQTGGPAGNGIRVQGTSLIIRQTREHHDVFEDILRQLRDVMLCRARLVELLDRKLPAIAAHDGTLDEVIQHLQQVSGCPISIDWVKLAKTDIRPGTHISIGQSPATLRAALQQLVNRLTAAHGVPLDLVEYNDTALITIAPKPLD